MEQVYDSYKDSGIPWIGAIPEGWEVCRLKNFISLKGRVGWKGLRSDEFQLNSYAYLVTGQDFKGATVNWNNCYQIDKKRYEEDPFIQLSNGDILVTKDGTIGKVAMVQGLNKPACLNSGIFVLKQKTCKFNQKYLYWLLCSSLLADFNFYRQSGGTTIVHLYQNVFELMPMVLPDLSEQQAIASYLDLKCADIDELVSLQDEMIKELEAYKQSIITEAVTKGLDPNVPMKDSGIPWIGEIPESWGEQRLKYLCTIQTGNKDTQDADPEGFYPFYVRSPIVEGSNDYSFDGEGILMAGDGAGAGRVFHHAYGKYAVHQRVYRLANIRNVESNYLFYFMTNLFCKEMDRGSAQSTVPSVRLPMLENFKICIPSIFEQQSIASYLDEKCADIDAMISLRKKKIEELKEYKKSVIFEAVTGKIKVV